MALIKNKMTDFGIEANYWKLTMMSMDRFTMEGSFSLSLFLNKEAEKFIETYTVVIYGDEALYNECFENATHKDVQTSCYEYAKKNVEYFKDAEDDPEEKALNTTVDPTGESFFARITRRN